MSDLIRRNDAVEAIEFEKVYMTAYKGSSNGYVSEGNPLKQYNKGLDDAIKAVNSLPSAEPERTAKIHDDKIHPVIHYCGKDIVTLINPTWNYCPYCGKKLEWI